MIDLPDYDELPRDQFGQHTGWHLFGDADNVGLLNLQTPRTIADAARLVRSGRMFPLDAPIDAIDPPLYGRHAARHTVQVLGVDAGYDDALDDYYPQISSQWDALAHAAYRPGIFYNGFQPDNVTRRHSLTVDHWARRGIAGRGVVLDVSVELTDSGLSRPDVDRPITVADLDSARARAGVSYRPGDVLLIHTGFLAWYSAQDDSTRHRFADDPVRSVGLEHSEEMARYLWNAHVSAVASDVPALEVSPPDSRGEAWPHGYLHNTLIGRFGMAIGELWQLADLAADCRSDGIYECFLVSSPLHVPGGVGSPANAMAIK